MMDHSAIEARGLAAIERHRKPLDVPLQPADPYADVPPPTADPINGEEHGKAVKRPTLASQLLSLADLGNLPGVEPLVDGLLYRNTVAQLSGPPGSYKSFISLGIACALASGQRNWAGHRIPKREKVVYVAAEGASGLRVRILAWCESENVNPAELDGWLHILPVAMQLGAVVQVAEAVQIVRDVGAGLLVLDTRARCTLGLEENSATEQGRAFDNGDSIRAASRCTVWVIHHTGRNGSTPRGSTAWDGAIWSDLRLTAEAGAPQIRVEKHKDAPSERVYDYRMVPRIVPEALMPGVPEEFRKSLVVFSSGGEKSSAILTGILKTVEKVAKNSCGLEGLSRTALVDLAVTDGVSKASAYRAVNLLVEVGRLHNVGTEKQRRYIYMDAQLGGD